MIKVVYDPTGQDKSYLLDCIQLIINFLRAHGIESLPVFGISKGIVQGSLIAVSLNNEETGQIEELAIYQLRDRWYVNRGVQAVVVWFHGENIIDFVCEQAIEDQAVEVEWPVHSSEHRVIYNRRQV